MDFRGASADAVAALTEELKTAVSASPEAAAKAADTLFEVSQTLRAEAALRRFVTDASVPQEAKTGLVGELFGGKVDATGLGVFESAVKHRWTHAGDLSDAVERLSEIAAVRSAGGEATRLADELFAVQQAVQETPELRDALSDPARTTEDKAALVDTLLGGKALPATVTLTKQALAGTYRTASAALGEYQKVAASVAGEGTAVIRVAAPLSEAETTRLAGALARKYGREVHLNVVVDPAVVGGIKVSIGDDVIDGTVSSRLEGAQRALAG
ncbi:F0F1 ATP synthase subunit delta [Nocardioides sp. NBC_00163]|uniref:F0F1 ATP synthase subunit delta n=1 Tax=unclassified Nocardioides TaxID=2615069 RepID=UPI003244C116